jgi:hypothetical protein
MSRSHRILLATAVVPVLLAGQQPAVKVRESRPGLVRKAKISADSAIAIARARVPGGTIREAELEVEHRRLIYSFDIQVAGTPGITEVNVDARTGAVVGVDHEGPADEAREKAQEKRAHPKDSTSGS